MRAMRPVVTDQETWSVGRSDGLSVCCTSEPCKTAEPIEMPYVLDRGPDPPWEGAILREKRGSHGKVYGHSAVICAKTAEPIKMPFGLWARMGLRNHVLDGCHGNRGNHFLSFYVYMGCTLAPPGEYD